MESEINFTADNLTDFDFYQLVEILSKKYHFKTNNFNELLMEGSLFTFSSNPSIGFPTSDIEEINLEYKKSKPNIEIVVNFLGLQGANGPLPGAVLNDIAYEAHDQNNIKKIYLDFFNHHLISLLYTTWRKYKYYIQFESDFSDNFSQKILSLLGVTQYHLKTLSINWGKLLFYTGLIQSNIRTAKALSDLVRYYFDLNQVTINEYERQLISIDREQQNQLGNRNITLNDDFVIGETITTFTNKFTINIRGLDTKQFHQFLPSGKNFLELKEIIEFFLKDPLPYDLCLGLHPQTESNFILGSSNSSFLGWSTLLNTDSFQKVNIKEIIIAGQA